MFVMTHNVTIEGVNSSRPFKASELRWSRSISEYCDSASIKIPLITRLNKNDGDLPKSVPTDMAIKEGMKVIIEAGYNKQNDICFMGFVRRVNISRPSEVVCEGYSYQIRAKKSFIKNYKNTTVKEILTDLISDTEIMLSNSIPEVRIDKAVFTKDGISVLDWLKEKCLLTVYFNLNELYCGLEQLDLKQTKKFRVGWNLVDVSNFILNKDKELSEVRIEISSREPDGSKKKGYSGKKDNDGVIRYTSVIRDEESLKAIARQIRRRELNRGYEGSVTAFLKPHVVPGMAVEIEDATYTERNGKYFVSRVDGEFSKRGGRQKIVLGGSL